MKNSILENADIKERVRKGLDKTFEKLIIAKTQANGILVLSQNGVIKKIKASELQR